MDQAIGLKGDAVGAGPPMNDEEAERESTQAAHSAHDIPPADGGIVAWRFLAIGFVFETLLWGFPLSFGVFQEYYSRLPQFQGNPYIGVVGTIASGLSYIAAPFVIPFVGRNARYRRLMIWIGWPLCLLGLVAGSFATTLEVLILTQGVLYGVGFVIFYYPILSMLTEYWVERRGMAAGLMCGASGLAGTCFPFAIQALLQKYGYQTTLRCIAVGLAVLTGPLIPFMKGRLPEANVNSAERTDWSFVRKPVFWIYSISNLAMGFGYFLPGLYLPSYAVSNGLTPSQGALLLAMMSIAQALGQPCFGYASDHRMPIDMLALISTLLAAVAIYTCWGFAHSFPVMAVFAIIYGFFASGYTAIWMRIGTTSTSTPTASFAVFGLLNLGKGIGNVLTGPIGGWLVSGDEHESMYAASRYQKVVLFSGSCMLLSAAIVLSYRGEKVVSLLKTRMRNQLGDNA